MSASEDTHKSFEEVFRVLGIELEGRDPKLVPEVEIKKASRKLNGLFHESRFISDGLEDEAKTAMLARARHASERMKEINAAYNIVKSHENIDAHHGLLRLQEMEAAIRSGKSPFGRSGNLNDVFDEILRSRGNSAGFGASIDELISELEQEPWWNALNPNLQKEMRDSVRAEAQHAARRAEELRRAEEEFRQRAGRAGADARDRADEIFGRGHERPGGRSSPPPPRSSGSGGSGVGASGGGGSGYSGRASSTIEAEAKGGKVGLIVVGVVAAVVAGYALYRRAEKKKEADKQSWVTRTETSNPAQRSL